MQSRLCMLIKPSIAATHKYPAFPLVSILNGTCECNAALSDQEHEILAAHSDGRVLLLSDKLILLRPPAFSPAASPVFVTESREFTKRC